MKKTSNEVSIRVTQNSDQSINLLLTEQRGKEEEEEEKEETPVVKKEGEESEV